MAIHRKVNQPGNEQVICLVVLPGFLLWRFVLKPNYTFHFFKFNFSFFQCVLLKFTNCRKFLLNHLFIFYMIKSRHLWISLINFFRLEFIRKIRQGLNLKLNFHIMLKKEKITTKNCAKEFWGKHFLINLKKIWDSFKNYV